MHIMCTVVTLGAINTIVPHRIMGHYDKDHWLFISTELKLCLLWGLNQIIGTEFYCIDLKCDRIPLTPRSVHGILIRDSHNSKLHFFYIVGHT